MHWLKKLFHKPEPTPLTVAQIEEKIAAINESIKGIQINYPYVGDEANRILYDEVGRLTKARAHLTVLKERKRLAEALNT